MISERDEHFIDAYLDGELLPEDRAVFERRLDREPELNRALDRAAAVRAAMAGLRQPAPSTLVEDVMAAVEEEIIERSPRHFSLWGLPLESVAAAAVILLALVAGSHFYRMDRLSSSAPNLSYESSFQTALAPAGGRDEEPSVDESSGSIEDLLATTGGGVSQEEPLLIAAVPEGLGVDAEEQKNGVVSSSISTMGAEPQTAGNVQDATPERQVFARRISPATPASSVSSPPEPVEEEVQSYDLRSTGLSADTATRGGISFLLVTEENVPSSGDETAPIEYNVIVSFILPKAQMENLRTLARQVGGTFVLSEPEEDDPSDEAQRAGFTYPYARQDQVRRKLVQMGVRELRTVEWEIQAPPRRIYVEVLFE